MGRKAKGRREEGSASGRRRVDMEERRGEEGVVVANLIFLSHVPGGHHCHHLRLIQ